MKLVMTTGVTVWCLLTLFSVTCAGQQFYDSGTEFLRVCSVVERIQIRELSAAEREDARACESYVVGVADGVAIQHTWSASHGDRNPAAFCTQPRSVPAAQQVRKVVEYVRKNPERGQFRAIIAVEEALHGEFPCR